MHLASGFRDHVARFAHGLRRAAGLCRPGETRIQLAPAVGRALRTSGTLISLTAELLLLLVLAVPFLIVGLYFKWEASRQTASAEAGGRDQPKPRQAATRGYRLPRRFGWMLGTVGSEQAARLKQLLADPEAVALIKAAPGFAGTLGPLCKAMGVVPPAGLLPPARRRRRAPPAAEGATPATQVEPDGAQSDRLAQGGPRAVHPAGAYPA